MEWPAGEAVASEEQEEHGDPAARGPQPAFEAGSGGVGQFGEGEFGGIGGEGDKELPGQVDAAVAVGQIQGVPGGERQGDGDGDGESGEQSPGVPGLAAQAQPVGQGRHIEDQQFADPDQGVSGGEHASRSQGRNADTRDDETGRDDGRRKRRHPGFSDDAGEAEEDDQGGEDDQRRDPAGNARLPQPDGHRGGARDGPEQRAAIGHDLRLVSGRVGVAGGAPDLAQVFAAKPQPGADQYGEGTHHLMPDNRLAPRAQLGAGGVIAHKAEEVFLNDADQIEKPQAEGNAGVDKVGEAEHREVDAQAHRGAGEQFHIGIEFGIRHLREVVVEGAEAAEEDRQRKAQPQGAAPEQGRQRPGPLALGEEGQRHLGHGKGQALVFDPLAPECDHD